MDDTHEFWLLFMVKLGIFESPFSGEERGSNY